MSDPPSVKLVGLNTSSVLMGEMTSGMSPVMASEIDDSGSDYSGWMSEGFRLFCVKYADG